MNRRALSEPRYDQLFEPIPTGQLLACIDWAVLRLRELRLAPPPQSRFLRARDLIQGLGADPEALRKATRSRRLLMEAHRTGFELYAIARSLNPRLRAPDVLRRKLAIAHGGADDPAKDTEASARARDYQFELWVAAWLAAGGKPVRLMEPDLQVAQWFQWRGVAAKRVRSRRKILARVKEAAAQIKKHTPTGFVALALDNYSVPRSIRSRSELGAGSAFFASYPEIDVAVDYLENHAPWVKALICFGHFARWLPDRGRPSLQRSNLTQIYQLPADQAEEEQLSAFFEEHRVAFSKAFRSL